MTEKKPIRLWKALPGEQLTKDERLLIRITNRIIDESHNIRETGKCKYGELLYWIAYYATEALNELSPSEVSKLAKNKLLWPMMLTAFVNEERPKTPSCLGSDFGMKTSRNRKKPSFYTVVAQIVVSTAIQAWQSAKDAPPSLIWELKAEWDQALVCSLPKLTPKTAQRWYPILLKPQMDILYPHFRDCIKNETDQDQVDTEYKRKNYFRKHVMQAIRNLLLVS